MFGTLAIATDLSEASDHVIGCLHSLVSLGAREGVLVHALGLRHLDELKHTLARQAEPALAKQKATLESQGIATEVVIAPGLPALEVNRIARERGASLIVVGSHGETLAREFLLGGVALAVIQRATLPVLIVRLRVNDAQAEQRCEVACHDFLRHVLYATDFSDGAERALSYVARLVEAGAKRVTLLHVQDKAWIEKHLSDRLEEFDRIDRERLTRIKTELELKGASDVATEIPYGSPIQEILRRVNASDVSLVVMGSQGRGFIADVFLGHVSHEVARLGTAPVLLIPSPR